VVAAVLRSLLLDAPTTKEPDSPTPNARIGRE
jgi:hypothetical protein